MASLGMSRTLRTEPVLCTPSDGGSLFLIAFRGLEGSCIFVSETCGGLGEALGVLRHMQFHLVFLLHLPGCFSFIYPIYLFCVFL